MKKELNIYIDQFNCFQIEIPNIPKFTPDDIIIYFNNEFVGEDSWGFWYYPNIMNVLKNIESISPNMEKYIVHSYNEDDYYEIVDKYLFLSGENKDFFIFKIDNGRIKFLIKNINSAVYYEVICDNSIINRIKDQVNEINKYIQSEIWNKGEKYYAKNKINFI